MRTLSRKSEWIFQAGILDRGRWAKAPGTGSTLVVTQAELSPPYATGALSLRILRNPFQSLIHTGLSG
jgi:hypothetical protein